VVGPFFSGSRDSLGGAIKKWRKCHQSSFDIISGSATNINGDKFSARFLERCDRFRTTLHAELILKWEMMKYLGVKENGSERVAILVESSTALGVKEANPVGVTRANAVKYDAHQPEIAQANKENTHSHSKSVRIHLPFPLHISTTRTAYNHAQSASAPLPQLPSLSGQLHIPPAEGPAPKDTEPSLTPSTTGAIAEQTLSHMLSTLAKERIQYVVILATDPKLVFDSANLHLFAPQRLTNS
jgi:hypothetical protein